MRMNQGEINQFWRMDDPMQWASCRNRPFRLPPTHILEAHASEINMVVSDYRQRVCGIDVEALAAERSVIEWFCQLHFQEAHNVRGEFVSGSSEAILAVLWRCKSLAKARGLTLVVIGTVFTHYSVARACDMLSVAYREAAADELGRVSFQCLGGILSEHAQSQSLSVVVLTLGMSATGESDDLGSVKRLRETFPNLIVHVDGAIGGLSARFLLDELPLLDMCGIDSISCDLHKSGLCCFGSGVVCMREEIFEAAGCHVPAFSGCLDYGVLGSRSSISPVLAAEVVARMRYRWRSMFNRQIKMRDVFASRISECSAVRVFSCPRAVPMLTLSVEKESARIMIEAAFSTPFYDMPGKSEERKFCRLFFNRQNNINSVKSAADMIGSM